MASPLTDPFGRTITYLRLSLTDRCDLRCHYCLPQQARFMAKRDLLTIDELDRVGSAFVRLGVTKLRLTGGEPLVRPGAVDLARRLGRHLDGGGLSELVMTTNGTQLARHAEGLANAGIRRINVSLDHLDPAEYARITRGGRLAGVLEGIAAAQAAGIAVKINTVALACDNADILPDMARWAHGRGLAITFIEVMPMGEIGADRTDQHIPLDAVRAQLDAELGLQPLAKSTGGPARYARTAGGGEIGFITPISENFCGGCNRVRVDAGGQLHACLGRDENVDLKAALREHSDDAALDRAIAELIARKPERHDFAITRAQPAVARAMAATGG